MSDDTIFREKSPLGYTVVCTQSRWNHVLSGHSTDMSGRIKEVELTISNPQMIYDSKHPSGRHVYFGNTSTKFDYTEVVV
jgi:hypothetical protein